MSSSQRVLVVGGTGRLGTKIVRELLARGVDVRVTYRNTAPEIDGVELVAADLADEASLDRACEGIDVVVSAVQGLADVIVDGQTRLVAAAERMGVARMLPSDYAVDFFRTPEGRNRNLDLRRAFNHLLDKMRVRGVSVLNGAFMDMLGRGMGPGEDGVWRVFGDPDQPYDFTHTDDVAAFIAAAALDPEPPRHVKVIGDSKSPRQICEILGEVRGIPARVESAGSLDDMTAIIDRLRAEDPAPTNTFPRWQQMQYGRDMASGLGVLDPIDNARYPDVHPTDIRAFLSRR